MDTQITFRIKGNTRKALKEIARLRELSESDVIREAVREKVDSFFGNKSNAFNRVYRTKSRRANNEG